MSDELELRAAKRAQREMERAVTATLERITGMDSKDWTNLVQFHTQSPAAYAAVEEFARLTPGQRGAVCTLLGAVPRGEARDGHTGVAIAAFGRLDQAAKVLQAESKDEAGV